MRPRLLPSLITDEVLTTTELRAAELDGDLRSVGSVWLTSDTAEDAQTRARILASLLPPRLIAERRSAAWVHGAISAPPRVHQLCGFAWARPPQSARALSIPVEVREVELEPHEVTELGALVLTSRLRTAFDLARIEPVFGDSEREAIRRLVTDSRVDPDEFVASVETRGRMPDKKRALERIRRALR